jgi:taurine dioxygenase
MGTILYAKDVPPAGGDTMYANMYMAYDALSDGMKELAGKLKTFNIGDRMKSHGREARKDRYKGAAAMRAKVKDPGDAVTEAVHPLVRTHPETGQKAIYLGNHAQHFEGMTEEESAPLLKFFSKHATQPEFVCRFRWQVGSLALWDNRCTQHYAVGDYNGLRRRMHRITIAGDRPF